MELNHYLNNLLSWQVPIQVFKDGDYVEYSVGGVLVNNEGDLDVFDELYKDDSLAYFELVETFFKINLEIKL